MATNKQKLFKGIKYIAGSFPLLFLAPIIITVGLKSIKINGSYWIFGIGIFFGIMTVWLGFKGIRIILNSLFDS